MKRFNFNIKDRKVLTLGLCLILVCVFTLTIAYAALNAVLTIQGTAQVSSADWDIHLANPKVTNGSATTNVPQIKTNSTMDFSTTLNMPGDFYEFTVDVVNSGSIDAMINSVIKNPELDASQKKYLNYEVTYQNGESITTKQTLAHGTTMPIKVRVEYRKDLIASDLPTGQVVLDLSLTLEYIQSDGTSTSVPNNGVGGDTGEEEDPYSIEAYGSLDEIGTIVKIGTEKFYTIGTDGDNVKLLTMYNLHIGNEVLSCEDEYGNNCTIKELDSPTGKQSPDAKGATGNVFPYIGTIDFNSFNLRDYRTIIEGYGVVVNSIRLISLDELTDSETFACEKLGPCSDKYPFIYSTSYWTSGNTVTLKYGIVEGGFYDMFHGDVNDYLGVRPVVIVPKDTFN